MVERISFYMDEHVETAVVKGLRQRGVDVLTVVEADMLGASDKEHLALAYDQRHVFFTHDTDFLRIHLEGRAHAGLVCCHQQKASIGEVIFSGE